MLNILFPIGLLLLGIWIWLLFFKHYFPLPTTILHTILICILLFSHMQIEYFNHLTKYSTVLFALSNLIGLKSIPKQYQKTFIICFLMLLLLGLTDLF